MPNLIDVYIPIELQGSARRLDERGPASSSISGLYRTEMTDNKFISLQFVEGQMRHGILKQITMQ